jgi:hypothetical protein
MSLAWSSLAALAIAPLQDVLNLGAELKFLSPDETQPQWAGLSVHRSVIEFTVRRIEHYTVVTFSDRAGP